MTGLRYSRDTFVRFLRLFRVIDALLCRSILHYVVCVGEMFARTTAPSWWVLCRGSRRFHKRQVRQNPARHRCKSSSGLANCGAQMMVRCNLVFGRSVFMNCVGCWLVARSCVGQQLSQLRCVAPD